ncbi:MAG: RNA-binding protein [Deltaproteobacteria bacterium]|nr:MAG: RNA-binding protein [Deltaproteobacteria bacterium]
MSKRLAVGNLSQQMTGEELQNLFSEAGMVASTQIISYLHNGETCGFGFVEMKTMAEGRNAISILNGRQVAGRLLVVKADGARSNCLFGRRRKKG